MRLIPSPDTTVVVPQPDVVAIYIGDDRTDEDAFKALQEGRQGGWFPPP